jgi:uncharacterized protein DUF3224
MKTRAFSKAVVVAGMCLALAAGSPGSEHRQTSSQRGAAVTLHAKGSFEVKMTPQPADDKSEDAAIGRFSIDKQFHGDLDGTSKGQMLGSMTTVKGSAGYVAIEHVTGTLAGRSGGFVLLHNGTMNRGALQQNIVVVPDSATGQLTGLTGSMSIEIINGKHLYDFSYNLPETP